jgi:hypothetical protein
MFIKWFIFLPVSVQAGVELLTSAVYVSFQIPRVIPDIAVMVCMKITQDMRFEKN